jgi:hypothetical protein
MSVSEWELWACATQVIATHGSDAPLHVAEQIGALVLAGDAKGIRTWQAIATRIVELTRDPMPATVLH